MPTKKNKVKSPIKSGNKIFRINNIPVILILFLIYSCTEKDKNHINLNINEGWVFKAVGDSVWYPAEVPGCVHTDLMANNLIEDPYYRLNEHDLQWIDKKNWEYKTEFKVDKYILEKDVVSLKFNGLDTHADVYINDSLVLKTNNMFISWEVNCRNILHPGLNKLNIIFKSPINEGLRLRERLGYYLPGAENDQSLLGGLGDIKVNVFSRKAGYHFGWDWGPRLVTSGIWKDIELYAYSTAKFNDIQITQNELTDTLAVVTANIEISSEKDCKINLSYKIDNQDFQPEKIELKKGLNSLTITLNIRYPELWWTNGTGDQRLYNISFSMNFGKNIIDNGEIKIGLRTLEIVQDPDSIGSSFYVRLNGFPIFMKGANYIPQDMFLTRVKPSDYEDLIKSAADANMNMLRVWGGGIYEKDIFYDLCDKYGILVWQDFMFACAMYPGNSEFLDNVKKEAIQNVKRLRNHPSIALWCGDNENLIAWNRWGWKEKVIENQGQEVADTIWHAYDTLFHSILPELVKTCDDNRFYWASSPSAGIGELENGKSGDMHYWGVWWAKEPFSRYEEVIPRFMSEYGFQSFPDINSVKKYTIEEDYDIYSEVMKSHQRSSIGNATIEEYLLRDYNKPEDFETFLYVGQLLQARGINTAIEAHRRNMPHCMGSLYWQLNDVWPVASWSGIDWYGDWKALHYTVKEAFKNVMVSHEIKNDTLKFFIISDVLGDFDAQLDIKVMNFKGEIINSQILEVIVKENSSSIYLQENISELTKKNNPDEILIYAALTDLNNKEIDNSFIYLLPPKELTLPYPDIKININSIDSHNYRIIVSSNIMAKNVYLQIPFDGHLSDNYFDMLPGSEKELIFEPKEESGAELTIKDIKIYTLADRKP